jgi:Lrp/AsnC family leucine-responsive transcriptional regulator
MIDEIDRKILTTLQDDARASNAAIARRVGLVPSAVLERIRKLEKRRVIQGYEARIDPAAVGRGLLAFIFVRTNERAGALTTGDALALVPEVQEVHHVAGEDCYLVKVRSPSPAALGKLLRESFGGIATVSSTRTTIVLETVKEHGPLPFDETPTCQAPNIAEPSDEVASDD